MLFMKQRDGADVATSNGGNPPNPLLPRQGWMSPLRMGGGPPKPPHSRARGGCRLFEWGGDPPNPPTPAPRGQIMPSRTAIFYTTQDSLRSPWEKSLNKWRKANQSANDFKFASRHFSTLAKWRKAEATGDHINGPPALPTRAPSPAPVEVNWTQWRMVSEISYLLSE